MKWSPFRTAYTRGATEKQVSEQPFNSKRSNFQVTKRRIENYANRNSSQKQKK